MLARVRHDHRHRLPPDPGPARRRGRRLRRPPPVPHRRRLSHLDPFLLFDHMGPVRLRSRPGRRHAVAPPPRLRDRHVPARGRHGAPRLPGQPRLPAHGRHPVDDRRLRRAPQGGPERRGTGRRRPDARPAAVGEPARVAEDGRARVPGPARRGQRPAARAGRRPCASSPASLFDLHGPGSTHTPISYAHVTLAAGASVHTTPPRRTRAARLPDDRWRPRGRHAGRRRRPRRRRGRRPDGQRCGRHAARSSCSPANRSASPSPATARS